MTLAVSHCPKCHDQKLQAKDSRPHIAYGFRTIKRRRACPICNFKISTIELPITIGNDVFLEEEE